MNSQPDNVGNLLVERSAGNLHATFVRGTEALSGASSYQLINAHGGRWLSLCSAHPTLLFEATRVTCL